MYRYYLAPEGLLRTEDLPARWGLIEVTAKGVLKPRHGHVLLKYREEDTWRRERATGAGWTVLAQMLNRVGGIEKVQNWLKESRNINARLAKRNDELHKQNDRLAQELFLARHPECAEGASPLPALALEGSVVQALRHIGYS